ncbi:MAG: NAD(P)-dependent oxidoreductase [Ignavibacteria bacterium]|nr:NAD(P)-dependent oxidoreductase [Ignavibacteria bacterium]MBI3765543.1 NAD(P)-dependent oxidoreductase [Ignavibacteriales bacterium]
MNNLAPKLTSEQYENNFTEIHPAFNQNQATVEANRCLYCFDSPCMKACPTHIDISTFIKKIATGNIKGSAKTILESNWIALTCAKACPVDVLCEGACVYNERGEKPIEIGRLQRYAIDWYFEHGMPSLFTPTPKNGKSVGVIGAGPAGLACAAELALLGYDVTIYEGKDLPGGLDTMGIAPYKMSYMDSLKEVKLVESFGVKIKTRVWVGTTITLAETAQMHDAIFLSIGLGNSPDLNIPGEHLEGVCDALEFIENVTTRNWNSVDVGKRVAVIGAGNTAIDAATEAKRLGAEQVMIIYRRSEEEMPAYEFEYDLAKRDGIVFHFLTAPSRIIGNGQVEGLECVKMKLGMPDVKGRRTSHSIPNSEFRIPVDMVIKSIGQKPAESFLSQISNLKFERGKIWVNTETMQTSHPKYFAGGDCINGGKEVVNAAADGKRAAHGIDEYLFSRK